MPATPPTTDELVAFGAHCRVSYLLQQAGYTYGIASGDGPALAALLPTGYLAAYDALRARVQQLSHDRDNAAEESRMSAAGQNAGLRSAKVIRRRIAKRGERAERLGHDLPYELTHVGRSKTVPSVLESLGTMIAHFDAHMDAMNAAGPGADALIASARSAHESLRTLDAMQETQRLAALPAAVRAYVAAKGELYLQTKVVNAAGHELHAGDLTAAAKYNLAILHRHPGAAGLAPSGSTPATPGASGPAAPPAPPAATPTGTGTPPRSGSALLAPLVGTAALAIATALMWLVR
jgi:hypothetical protein